MSYCPNCDYDYETNAVECPDCQEYLVGNVASISTAAVTPDDSWIVVAGISDDFNKDLAKDTMDSNNIPYLIVTSSSKEETKKIAPLLDDSLDNLDNNLIVVPKEFREKAVIVLAELLRDELNIHRLDNWI